MLNEFYDKFTFELYNTVHTVETGIKGEQFRVKITVTGAKNKVMQFNDIEKYIKQIAIHLDLLWTVNKKRQMCEEYKNTLFLVNSHIVYSFAKIVDYKIKQGFTLEELNHQYPAAFRRIKHLI